MKLMDIVDEVQKKAYYKRGYIPYVNNSPVSNRAEASLSESEFNQCMVETDDPMMVPKFDLTSKFIGFTINELGIKNPVRISLVSDRETHGVKTFAYYDEEKKHCVVYTKDRNLADILRSVAHELVHKSQFEKNQINGPVQDIGGEIENEANAVAGQLIKKFGYDNQEIFE